MVVGAARGIDFLFGLALVRIGYLQQLGRIAIAANGVTDFSGFAQPFGAFDFVFLGVIFAFEVKIGSTQGAIDLLGCTTELVLGECCFGIFFHAFLEVTEREVGIELLFFNRLREHGSTFFFIANGLIAIEQT